MTKDTIVPTSTWEFNEEVTAVFDDMLARSIPQYDVMRKAVFDLCCRYIEPHTAVIDMGSSRGGAVADLIEKYPLRNLYYLTEISEPMLLALKERFHHYIENVRSVIVIRCDLRRELPVTDAKLALSILTLQFTPIEYRQQIIRRVYKTLLPGGAFILVEKILGDTADIDDTMVKIYYDMKRENGYTDEQIERKRLSLEGVLVPVTARWNEELLRSAGFTQVDCFWRWMNFAGWLAVKD